MRLKNVKNAEIRIEKSDYLIKEAETLKGKWSTIFNNSNPIEVEIGMGKGDFIISKALDNPNINYIGIEKYASVLLRATEKLYDKDIPNLKLILLDASLIDNVFDHEIDLIYLNFSDPWPKNRHYKRRLTSPVFLEKYKSLFKKDIFIKQKTDNDDLFEYSKKTFLENGYKILDIDTDYGLNPNNTNKTEYEKKFISNGKNINYIFVTKK